MKWFRGGSWWVGSELDPRWNCEGHVDCLSAFVMTEDATKAIEKLKARLGEPPKDLSYGCMKD